MSGFNLSTYIYHVANLSRNNSKKLKRKFWSHDDLLDKDFVRISKIVRPVYAKGLSVNK